ncbi:MAG: Holliday junction branch migration protein RuvA [Bacillota bacterium]
MISYLNGTIAYQDQDEGSIILDVGGIGYEVFCSPRTLSALPQTGEQAKIFTYMSVKDDGISLFGFLARDDRKMFLKLLSVSGVGPKGALAILSAFSPQEIAIAVLSNDVTTISKAKGVGKKTAQRIILELKDKCSTDDALQEGVAVEFMGSATEPKIEAMEALIALGYSPSEASKAVKVVDPEGLSTEEILKLALQLMMS